MLWKLSLAIAAAASFATVAQASSATFEGGITDNSALFDETGSFQRGDKFVGSFIWDSSKPGYHRASDIPERMTFAGAFKSASFDVIRDGQTIYAFDLKARQSEVDVDSLTPGIAYYIGFYETSEHPFLQTNFTLPIDRFQFALDFGNGATADGGAGTPYTFGALPGAIDFTAYNMALDGGGYHYIQIGIETDDDFIFFQAPILAQGVPEPATWVLLILGIWTVGSISRRRRAASAVRNLEFSAESDHQISALNSRIGDKVACSPLSSILRKIGDPLDSACGDHAANTSHLLRSRLFIRLFALSLGNSSK